MKITSKDWDRMLDLVMKNDDGDVAAKLIKDKNKAAVRFVCGLKLSNCPLRVSPYGYRGNFSSLGDRAVELRATHEEIQALYDVTEVPQVFIDKMASLADKKLNNRFVGVVSKAFLDSGVDIKYLPCNGNALTWEGREAMSRNGCKWTIGYKTQFQLNGRLVNFDFDAITDEGDGPTYYISASSSDRIFSRLGCNKAGRYEFIAGLKTVIASE